MTMRVHVPSATLGQKIHEYDAELLGAPFSVVLVDSVIKQYCAESDEKVRVIIPDMDGLLRMVAACRAVYSQKLSGSEIRFLRRAVGCKAKVVAAALDMSAENLSRVEAGSRLLGPQAEKMFRVFVIMQMTNDRHIKSDALSSMAKIMDLKISPVRSPDDVFKLRLSHCPVEAHPVKDDDGRWYDPAKAAA